MSIMRYSFVHWAALLTVVRNSPCSARSPFRFIRHRRRSTPNLDSEA